MPLANKFLHVESILRPYELKYFSEQLNEIKVDDDAITSPMEKFAGTTQDITHYNHPTWGCPVIVLDSILQGNIAGLPNWIYILVNHHFMQDQYILF